MIRKLVTACLVAIFATATAPIYAAGYIKMGDIKGESTDPDHKGWSDVQSLSWGTQKPGGGAKKAGDTSLDDVVVVKEWDSSAPRLQQAAADGVEMPIAMIEVVDDLGQLRQVYELYGVKVTSYSINGSGQDHQPTNQGTETLSLEYEQIRSVAFPVDPDEPPVEWFYSREANE